MWVGGRPCGAVDTSGGGIEQQSAKRLEHRIDPLCLQSYRGFLQFRASEVLKKVNPMANGYSQQSHLEVVRSRHVVGFVSFAYLYDHASTMETRFWPVCEVEDALRPVSQRRECLREQP